MRPLFFVAFMLWICLPLPMRSQDGRPGDAPYVPTKLEWAALELQTNYGVNLSRDNHVSVAFLAGGDGRTIECLVDHTSSVSAAQVKAERDITQAKFDGYAKSRGWNWLRLSFRELVLPF